MEDAREARADAGFRLPSVFYKTETELSQIRRYTPGFI